MRLVDPQSDQRPQCPYQAHERRRQQVCFVAVLALWRQVARLVEHL